MQYDRVPGSCYQLGANQKQTHIRGFGDGGEDMLYRG